MIISGTVGVDAWFMAGTIWFEEDFSNGKPEVDSCPKEGVVIVGVTVPGPAVSCCCPNTDVDGVVLSWPKPATAGGLGTV